jgi:hypothetical protein
MNLLKLLVVGTAAAAGYHYLTKRRDDGTSLADDLLAKASDLIEQVQPQLDRLRGQFENVSFMKGSSGSDLKYPEKFDNFSPDPDPGYSS